MSRTVKPISFDEIKTIKKQSIPDEIISAVNALIVKNWNGIKAVVKQDDILDMVVVKIPEGETIDSESLSENGRKLTRQSIFDNHYLDFEELYREQGWKVVFDKPGYNETYDAFFVFIFSKP